MTTLISSQIVQVSYAKLVRVRDKNWAEEAPSRKASCKSAADTHAAAPAIVRPTVPTALVMDMHDLLLQGGAARALSAVESCWEAETDRRAHRRHHHLLLRRHHHLLLLLRHHPHRGNLHLKGHARPYPCRDLHRHDLAVWPLDLHLLARRDTRWTRDLHDLTSGLLWLLLLLHRRCHWRRHWRCHLWRSLRRGLLDARAL